jgi:hypothetical protein
MLPGLSQRRPGDFRRPAEVGCRRKSEPVRDRRFSLSTRGLKLSLRRMKARLFGREDPASSANVRSLEESGRTVVAKEAIRPTEASKAGRLRPLHVARDVAQTFQMHKYRHSPKAGQRSQIGQPTTRPALRSLLEASAEPSRSAHANPVIGMVGLRGTTTAIGDDVHRERGEIRRRAWPAPN